MPVPVTDPSDIAAHLVFLPDVSPFSGAPKLTDVEFPNVCVLVASASVSAY